MVLGCTIKEQNDFDHFISHFLKENISFEDHLKINVSKYLAFHFLNLKVECILEA